MLFTTIIVINRNNSSPKKRIPTKNSVIPKNIFKQFLVSDCLVSSKYF